MNKVPKDFDKNCFETPDYFFQGVNKEFHFQFDLCAKEETKKVKDYFSEKEDSLKQDWFLLDGWLWINPPYKPLEPWVTKMQEESASGAKIVALVPITTITTNYFQSFYPKEIRILIGRINFLALKKEIQGNRQDHCLLIFDNTKSCKNPRVSWVFREDIKKGN